MYLANPNFADYRTSADDASLLTRTVVNIDGFDRRDPAGRKSGCRCGGKCKRHGTGDLTLLFTDPSAVVNNPFSLFTDSTGAISWVSVAIAAAAAFLAYRMLFGNSARVRRSALSKARTDYRRKRAEILAEYPRASVA